MNSTVLPQDPNTTLSLQANRLIDCIARALQATSYTALATPNIQLTISTPTTRLLQASTTQTNCKQSYAHQHPRQSLSCMQDCFSKRDTTLPDMFTMSWQSWLRQQPGAQTGTQQRGIPPTTLHRAHSGHIARPAKFKGTTPPHLAWPSPSHPKHRCTCAVRSSTRTGGV